MVAGGRWKSSKNMMLFRERSKEEAERNKRLKG